MDNAQEARQLAARAFAESIGAVPVPQALPVDTRFSSSEVRTLVCLAEAWERFAEDCNLAHRLSGADSEAMIVAFRDGVNQLQSLVEQSAELRRAWYQARLAGQETPHAS